MATVYFGAPNDKDLKVSDSLTRRGLSLLRSSPEVCNVEGHRLFPQHGYDFYANNLPIFIKSRILRKDILILSEGFDVSIPTDDCLPFSIPPVILCWKVPIADEVINGIKGKLAFEDMTIVSAKGPALAVYPKSTEDLRFIMSVRSDPICTAVDFKINPSCIVPLINIIKIATMFGMVHTYPCVHDSNHCNNLMAYYEMREQDVTMTGVEDGGDDEVVVGKKSMVFDGVKVPVPPEFSRSVIKMKDAPLSTQAIYISDITELPNSDGVWFPYISDLSSFDMTTVKTVIERHFFKMLGSTVNEQRVKMEQLRTAWGILGKTDTGKELSHYFKGIDLAIKTQSRIMPYMTGDLYEGFVLLGGAFWIRNRRVDVYPVTFDRLKGSIIDSSVHVVTLRKMRVVIGDTEFEPKSSRDLAIDLRKRSFTHEEKKEIMSLAKGFVFRENQYSINQTSLNIVCNVATNISKFEDLPEGFPVHPSLIFQDKMYLVAWGAFGDMAPSFRVPGGEKMSLEKIWKESVVGKGGAKIERDVTRISCRVVPLEKALEDLTQMIKDHCVFNPLKREGVRRGQFNMDRFFTGKEFINVITSLRMITASKIEGSTSAGVKRSGDDLDSGRPSKVNVLDEI